MMFQIGSRRWLAVVFLAISPGTTGASPLYDIVYLLDESGSITSTDFTAEKNFVVQSANGLVFGTNDTAASLVLFASTARVGINLTTSKQSFLNVVNNAVQTTGSSDL